MSFDWTWSVSGEVEIKPEYFGTKVHSTSGAHVKWTCSYPSRLVISTNTFDVDETNVSDKLFGNGAFNSGFSLTLHDGPELTTAIGQKDWIFNTRFCHFYYKDKIVNAYTCSVQLNEYS